jgi:hypothetical protein
MRIAPPSATIQPYIQPVPVVLLSPEASKALIASGIFDHDPNHVLWTGPGQAASFGAPIGSAASVQLVGGVSFQPRLMPKSEDRLSTVLLDIGKQSLPILEDSGADVVADSVALLVATPAIFHSLTSHDLGTAEKVLLYGNSIVRVLSIANKFVPIPHAETPLQVVSTIFKYGEEVYIAGAKQSAAG